MGKIKMKVFLSVLTLAAVYAVADVDEAAPNTSQEEVSEASPSQQDSVLDLNQEESKCIPPDFYPCSNYYYERDNCKSIPLEKLDSITKENWVVERTGSISLDSCQFRFAYSIKSDSVDYFCKATAIGNESLKITEKESPRNCFDRYYDRYNENPSYNGWTINRKIKDGKLNGFTKAYDANGILRSNISYKNGVRDGKEKLYEEDGLLRRERSFSVGKLNGTSINFDYNGNKHEELIYKNGVIQKDILYKRFNWIAGFSFTHCTIEYENESYVSEEIPYQKGLRHGIAKTFFSPCHDGKHAHDFGLGRIKKESPYKNGKLNGVVKEFYIDKKIKSTTPYENGELNGTVKEFYPNGKIKSTVTYEDGEAVSEKKCFSKNGKVQKIGTENMECD